MANTLTNLIPTIYEALDVVSREMIGFIPAVSRDTSAERAALNQTIYVPIAPAASSANNTPGVTPPDTGDQTIGSAPMTISKSKHVPIRWNGEQQLGMRNAGSYNGVLKDQFAQAFRTLANEIETDLFNAAYKGASRAYGTAGTAAFNTANDLSDAANIRKILDDNGAPQSDLHLVLGSAAVLNLRAKQAILLKANEAGSATFRHTGAISAEPISGFDLHNSNAIGVVTKGTGASYVTDGAVGAGISSILLKTGNGTVLAGDVVTFQADSVNKYVVNTGVAAAGTIVIGTPGTKVSIADANAMTIGGNYTPNVAFHRSAVQLITRVPAMPIDMNGKSMDLAEDMIQVQDPVSGIVFEVAVYRQYLQMVFHVRLAWGANAIKPDNIAVLIG